MEKKKVVSKTTGAIVSAKGGVRKGAGRPKGGTNQVSVNGLLAALERKTKRFVEDENNFLNGIYEEIENLKKIHQQKINILSEKNLGKQFMNY